MDLVAQGLARKKTSLLIAKKSMALSYAIVPLLFSSNILSATLVADSLTEGTASASQTSISPTDSAIEVTSLTPEQLILPQDTKFDWLQFTSLELLKGEIKNLYDDKLEFESDELDTILIDWEDVKVLQSAGL